MKLCKDCRNCVKHEGENVTPTYQCDYGRSLITGEIVVDCWEMRTFFKAGANARGLKHCGPEGKLWEEKEEKQS